MQTALGGAKKIGNIRDRDEIQSATTWNRDGKVIGKVIKRTRWIRPNILRLDQVGPGDTYVLYFDGNGGWEILPTTGQKAVIKLIGGELEFARKYLRDLDLNIWLADRDPRYTVASLATHVLRIEDGSDPIHSLDIILDPVTWLPVKETTFSLADPAHPVPSETRIEEWQIARGIHVPRRIVKFLNGVRAAEGTVEHLELNKGLKTDDLATPPADLNPVVSER
jgi:hypothetical protein